VLPYHFDLSLAVLGLSRNGVDESVVWWIEIEHPHVFHISEVKVVIVSADQVELNFCKSKNVKVFDQAGFYQSRTDFQGWHSAFDHVESKIYTWYGIQRIVLKTREIAMSARKSGSGVNWWQVRNRYCNDCTTCFRSHKYGKSLNLFLLKELE
jgi:hypothetical protein